jgi:lipopolysaccharide export LptBFGC system permease protein LptF
MNKSSRRLAALFVIGVAALYTPLLGAFNRPGSYLGIPLLPLYIFTAWIILVVVSWLLVRGDKS